MVKFIAEVSSNHRCDLERSLAFIDTAAKAGCQAIKFQLFKIDRLFVPEVLANSEKHRKRREWELPVEFLPALAKRCQDKGVEFSCTPFYLEAVAELETYVDFYKIASYELLWGDLLIACALTGKPVVLSTGMATMEEIQHAVDVLKNNGCPAPVLLHCTSSYPTPYAEANLAAIDTLRRETGCEVGWSDHTVEPAVIHRAIHKWGAKVVEFHLDLDGKGEEFAAGHCWLPDQIAAVIKDVNKGIEADGDGVKEPVPSELPDRMWRADPIDGLRPLKETRDRLK
ncbi:N-acetylneuraminate synthase family protein [Methylotuvimicrobium sp. KM2]|uniref:N-acetylneuraminate synthase family protein n=1 Tax=Methylotuvimicrobium sp. KM2 TaxID=3133976 RepID=UPI00310123A4